MRCVSHRPCEAYCQQNGGELAQQVRRPPFVLPIQFQNQLTDAAKLANLKVSGVEELL